MAIWGMNCDPLVCYLNKVSFKVLSVNLNVSELLVANVEYALEVLHKVYDIYIFFFSNCGREQI